MTLLDRYFGKRMTVAMLRVMVSMVLLATMIDLLTHTRESIAKYQTPPWAVGLYYLCMAPSILFDYNAAAMSVLVAGLMVLGKAYQDREITAALAGGVGLRRLTRVPLLLGLALSLLAFGLQETAGVQGARTMQTLREQYFSRYSGGGREGVSWANLSGGWTCHVLKFNRLANTGEDVFLCRIEGQKEIQEIRARRIFWDEAQARWLIEDGIWCHLYPQKDWEQSVLRVTQIQAPFLERPEDLFALDRPAVAKTSGELGRDLRRAEALGMPVQSYWVDYYAKFSQPALCFIMMLLAIPFSVRLNQGGRAAGLGMGIGIAVAYLLLFYAGIGLGHLGTLPPIVAAWLADVVFLGVGLVLYTKAPS